MLDAGSYAQLCCGAIYPDCVTDAPPLVFDAILLGESRLQYPSQGFVVVILIALSEEPKKGRKGKDQSIIS